MNFMCFEFINTQWQITHPPFKDPLLDKSWFDDFHKKWNLPFHTNALTRLYVQGFLDLRSALSNAVDTLVTGRELSDKLVLEINRYAKPVKLYYELKKVHGEYSAVLEAVKTGRYYLQHKIAVSFMEVLAGHEVHRIKICSNPSCGWVIFDESKNTTRRWCSNTCSSLIKVRRFREKQKKRNKT